MRQLLRRMYIKRNSLFIACIALVTATSAQQPNKTSPKNFSQGIIYSRTSFPGHPLNDSLKSLNYESDDYTEQYHVIQALKKHQQSIKGGNEQEIKDAFFVSGIVILPAYTKTYFTPTKTLIITEALGYHQKTLINTADKTGKLVIADRNKDNQGTVTFSLSDLKEVWQKYQVDAEQYTIQKTSETANVAGYPCKKIVYAFKGTSRGEPVMNYVINLEPVKVTVWYSDDVHPGINMQHWLFFELDKAVLKYEVEFDKNRKNKMLVEVVKLEPGDVDEETLQQEDVAPVVEHSKNKMESGMTVMKAVMAAISLLTK